MTKRSWMIVSALVVVGMAILVGVSVFMGGCSNVIETATGATVPMKCHWTFVATAFTGTIGVITALLALISSTKEGRRNAAVATLAAGAATVLLTTPAGIGLCANTDMHCHQAAIMLWATSAVVLVLALVQIAKADPQKATVPKMKL